jgi:hypothetical protein
MKPFSLSSLGRKAGETFTRFPLSIIAALAGTMAMLMVSHYDHALESEPFYLYKIVMSCYLVMLLSISVSLYAERFTFSTLKKDIAFVGVIILGVLYFYSLPQVLDPVSISRFILFVIGLHLLVAFVPFMVRAEVNGLWQFNKYIFIRILTSVLYSGVLFLGLLLALVAIDNLFNVHIEDKYFFDLWIIIAGIFNTWFFLSGVPHNLPALEDETSYPKGLKIFTVYVLLPLVCVYLAILYVYAGKILITAQWPVGWVGNLVIAFSVFGILSFLLVYPLRSDESQKWVSTYSRLFYFLLLPLIALLFAAIFKRVNMYGVTEERYFVVLLACWLAFISIYLILTRGNNIRTIPVSLCLIAFLSSFGPWGAFNVSRNSQMKELTALLDSNHVLKNNVVDTTVTHNVPSADYSRIEDIVQYLNTVHGYQSLQPFFTQNLDSVIHEEHAGRERRAYLYNDKLVGLMKLNKIFSAQDSINASSHYYKNTEHEMTNSRGYDFVAIFNFDGHPHSDSTRLILKSDTLYLFYSDTERKIHLSYKNFEPLILDAGGVMDSIYSVGSSPRETLPESVRLADFFLESDNKEWKAKVVFSELSVSKQSGQTSINYGSAMLFVRLNADNVDRENEVGEKKE